MTDSKPEGFQPAPWEAGGKRKTQGPQANPPGYGAPQGPPDYGQAPPVPGPERPTRSIPGPASPAFGGDMGRVRTRQIPNQAPGSGGPTIGQFEPRQADAGQQVPPAYSAPPAYPVPGQQGYPPPGGAPAPYGQPAGAPQQPYPTGAPQQPYGDTGYVPKKPITIMGIIALVLAGVGVLAGLVSLGFISWPFFIAGGVLGYLGIRETAAWGRKSGRGLAMGGMISNCALLLLNIAGVIALFALAQTVEDMAEKQNNATLEDGPLIVERIGKYQQAKGDLQPGGPQFKMGHENTTAVTGPALTVPDLCTPGELKNPIEQYSIEVSGDTATVWWTPKDGQRQQVGEYPSMGFDNWDWENDFDAQPPPRRHR